MMVNYGWRMTSCDDLNYGEPWLNVANNGEVMVNKVQNDGR